MRKGVALALLAAVATGCYFVPFKVAAGETSRELVVLAIMLTMSASWYAIMMVVLGRPTFARAYRRARVWIDRAAGAIFLGFGVRLATAD